MASPAAVLSIMVKAQGVQAASAQLGTLDKSARKAGTGLATTEGHAKRSSKSFSLLGAAAKTAGPLIGAAGLAAGVKSAVSEFREAQKVGGQTTAVLKSTGHAANVTTKEIQSLAESISKKTGIDDEAIQSSENMLLTFTKLRNETGKGNDIFNQATQTVTDMSVALGQSGKSSAIQLGKALNDPIKGVTALRRVGVAFTAEQQTEINTMVKHGNLLGAQKRILGELTTEFAGSAVAQATAGDRFKVSLNNLAEAAGAVLVPQIDRAAVFFTRLMDQMVKGEGVGGALVSKFQTAGNVIGSVAGTVRHLVGAFQQGNTGAVLLGTALGALTAGFVAYKTVMLVSAAATRTMAAAQALVNVAMTANPIGLVITALAALAAGLFIAYQKSKTFRDIVNAVGTTLRSALIAVISRVLGAFSSFLGAIASVASALGQNGLARRAREGQLAIDSLRDSMRDVPDKKDVAVNVKINLTGAAKLIPGLGSFDGTGEGVGRAINGTIGHGVAQIGKAAAKRAASAIPGLGSMIPDVAGKIGSLMGANSSLAPFAAVGAQFGLHVSSGKRAAGGRTSSGGISYHGSGQAIDLANGQGPDAAKLSAFRALKSRYGARLAELIYTPGGVGVKDGKPFRYTGAVAADHFDHVHVAFTGGGTALGQAGNRGDGPGNLNRAFPKHGSGNAAGHVQLAPNVVRQIAVSAGLPGPAFEQIAHGESTYFPGIVSNDGGWGLWQMTPRVWGAEAKAKLGQLGGIGQMLNPLKNAMMAKWLFDRGGLSPWYGTRYLTPEARATAGAAKGKKGPGFGALTGGGTADPSGASGGGGGSNAVSGAASAAAKVNPFDQKMATADLSVQQAQTGKASTRTFQQVSAMVAKRKLIGKRIQSIRKALKGNPSATKRLALTQELTQRLQEHAQLGTDIKGLVHPDVAATTAGGDIGGAGGIGGDGGDPNQALIDSNAALQAKIDEQIAADKEHADALKALKDEIQRQTDFAAQAQTSGNYQAWKALADIMSGQIGARVVGRGFTASTGVTAAY